MLLAAIHVFEHERAVQAMLAATPHELEWNLLQADTNTAHAHCDNVHQQAGHGLRYSS